jgi:hypothetical protein
MPVTLLIIRPVINLPSTPDKSWYTGPVSQGGLQQMERHPVDEGGFSVWWSPGTGKAGANVWPQKER